MGVSTTIFSPTDNELNYRLNIEDIPGYGSTGLNVPKDIVIKRKPRCTNRNLVRQYLRKSRHNILRMYKDDRRALSNPYLLTGLKSSQFLN